MTQGYLLIANGEEYAKMLQTYIIPTIRYWDTTRPITVLTTNPECFDPGLYSTIVYDPLPIKEKYLHLRPSKYFLFGTMPKLLIFDLSPYDETMYLDADILCMKDINDLWIRCAATNKPMVVSGTSDENNRAPVTWHWDTIDEVIDSLGFNVPRINGGFQYWRKTDDFIKTVDPYLLDPAKYKIKPWFRDGYVDEIFISIYLGLKGIHPEQDECSKPPNLNSIQTYRTDYYEDGDFPLFHIFQKQYLDQYMALFNKRNPPK